jgi:hypothetical protein
MEQVDGVVYDDGRAFLIESKDHDARASVEAIVRLRSRIEQRPPGTMALLFSSSGFTETAEIFAQFATPLNVLL